MKTLYIDCSMGAAGDMLAGALLDLIEDPDGFIDQLNALGIPGVEISREKTVKSGITGTYFSVAVNGIHEESMDANDHEDHHHHHHHHHDDQTESHDQAHSHAHMDHHHHEDGDAADHHHDEQGMYVHDHSHHDHSHSHHHAHHHMHDHHHAHHEHVHDHIHDHDHIHHTHTHDHVHVHMEHGHPHPPMHPDHIHADHHHHDHAVHPDTVQHPAEGLAMHHHHHGFAHSHSHNSLADIEHIVKDHLHLPPKVKEDILAIYMEIAKAESHAHGMPVSQVHFHEVGMMDAIADITAVSLLMDKIQPDQIIASPVHVGSGTVRCAHGILPVPAPATAYILEGVPIYGGHVKGELCTPTGAAILKHFVNRFGDMPVMAVEAIGYGMGTKNFETANCLRVMLAESTESIEMIAELSCNVDDMSPESIGFALEELYAAGALEVFTLSAGMKKSRPGVLLTVLCKVDDKDKMIREIFRLTTTIGIREQLCRRSVLKRKFETVDTIYGPVRKKISEGYGVCREKFEYDDLAAIARKEGITIAQVLSEIDK